jgi:SAM-dependent methyltransferase
MYIWRQKKMVGRKVRLYGMARLGLLKLLLFAGTQRMYGERLVSWLPTPADMATAALEWAEVGPSDVVYELGCGDGSVALAAAQRGARVVCVEIDEDLARGAEEIVKHAGLAHRVTVLQVTI